MSALQTMREQLERDLAMATTRRQERLIGQALAELAERIDFREHAELIAWRAIPPEVSGSVATCPEEFSLLTATAERVVVPSHPRRSA